MKTLTAASDRRLRPHFKLLSDEYSGGIRTGGKAIEPLNVCEVIINF